MQSLTSCECTICPECFAQHFTIAVKEKHITDLVCPACDAPDLSDEAELLGYFSTLDIQLRECLDPETYELFSKKLTERELMRDPKFQWCTHVSGRGPRAGAGPSQNSGCQGGARMLGAGPVDKGIMELSSTRNPHWDARPVPGGERAGGRLPGVMETEGDAGRACGPDPACGKETRPRYAGLCSTLTPRAHYKEYLVSLINARALDPARLYSLPELETVYQRHQGALPPRPPGEPEDSYRGRLLQKLMEEVPLGPKILRQRQ
ncbi:E3 ubiquitin-protein ligase RNF31 [Chelonoidis abingdonii]|uniref:E3 ubiquitin-protein ligase RNF31 n=1 Tax=Chelonoidis abingdonii TaxID=106734 RepID=UPI003F49151F